MSDVYEFTRQLRLAYHFRNSAYYDKSIVRLKSTYCPPANENSELERIIYRVEHINVSKQRTKNNLGQLNDAFKSLVTKVEANLILIKPADKGDVITIMNPEYYHSMCLNELNKTEYYRDMGPSDPSPNLLQVVKDFADCFRHILTPNEYTYLTERKYKMANFYLLPKLHKSQYINDMLQTSNSPYFHLENFTEAIEGRPIVGGPVYHTSGLSEMIDIILDPVTKYVPYLLKDSFQLLEKIDANPMTYDNVLLGTCDIKSLYTNINHDLALTAIDYWITLTWDFIDPDNRFTKRFVLEALRIILSHNYFYYDGKYFHQIKGFAMGTKAAVKSANLIVGYLEEKMFSLLPTIYPKDFVLFFIKNYFRLLDDILFKWLQGFDVEKLYKLFDELDPQLKFIFSTLAKSQDYLDISFQIRNELMRTSVYHKPTDSFGYLDYGSCHPQHIKDNIAVSLAKRIIRITSENRDEALDALQKRLESRGHPTKVINFAFTKVFTPIKPKDIEESFIFISTYSPSILFDKRKVKRCLDELHGEEMKKVFGKRKVICGSRQPKSLRNVFVQSRFDLQPPIRTGSSCISGLFPCSSCIYCTVGFVPSCTSFTFGRSNQFRWVYNRRFTCNAKNVIYIVICGACWLFYIGQTKDFKPRIGKHKSDAKLPHNSNCRTLAEHLHEHGEFFKMYPIYYEDDPAKRRFMEKRFILRFKPPLNGDK